MTARRLAVGVAATIAVVVAAHTVGHRAARPAPAATAVLRATPAAAGPSTAPGAARTGAGATEAATSFVTAATRVVAMADDDVAALVRSQVTAERAEAEVADTLARLHRLRAAYRGAPFSYRVGVVATTVTSFDQNRAQVAVWYVGVLTGSGQLPVAEWRTDTETVVWQPDGWKLDAHADQPGPRPVIVTATPTPLGDWPPVLLVPAPGPEARP